MLEISAHDVTSCSHGAAVGPVDDEQIFYSVPEAGTFYIRIEGATPDAFNAYDIDIAIQ